MKSLTQKLARFGFDFSLDTIPAKDVHYAKLLTLGLIGVAIAGPETNEAKSASILKDLVLKIDQPKQLSRVRNFLSHNFKN